MYNLLSKNGQTIGFALGFVVVAIYFIIIAMGIGDFNLLGEDDQTNSDLFNFGLRASIALVAISFLIALLFGVYHLITNFKSSIKFLIILAAILVVFFIGYSMADTDMASSISATLKEEGISEGISKLIGGSLILTLVLLAVSVVSFVVFEILNIFK